MANMRPVRAGFRDQLLTLVDVPETTVSSYGQPSYTGTTIGTFHGSVRQLKGDEILNVRQMFPSATHIVEMDWLGSAIPTTAQNPASLILPQMKLLLKKNSVLIKVLNIVAAENVDEKNYAWKLTCEEYVGAIS